MELRKIARVLGRNLSSIQYQLIKKMRMYKELYCGKKDNKVYVWSTVGVTKRGRKFYFYFLSNVVENLNSQMRDKISYLVRKTKAHSKSFEWLDYRLAMFFLNLNLKGKK